MSTLMEHLEAGSPLDNIYAMLEVLPCLSTPFFGPSELYAARWCDQD